MSDLIKSFDVEHKLSFLSKPVLGVSFYSWHLTREDAGFDISSTSFPSKTGMLSNCVRILGRDIRRENLVIDADTETQDELLTLLDNLYPEKVVRGESSE